MDVKEDQFGGGGSISASSSSRGSSTSRPRVLDSELAEFGLSGLGKSPDRLAHAYLRFQLQGQNLIDVALLAEYPHLQDIDLSDNSIKDVSVLGELPHLHRLNVSNNRITSFLDFKTAAPAPAAGSSAAGTAATTAVAAVSPRCLRDVDYSYNGISALNADLIRCHKYLTSINLRGNRLNDTAFDALSAAATNLTALDLSANEITDLTALTTAVPARAGSSGGVRLSRLTHLNLSRNRLTSVACLKRGVLPSIRVLDLTANKLTSTAGLNQLPTLTVCRLGENTIAELETELAPLNALAQLRDLDLRGNGVTGLESYRLRSIFTLSHLSSLDGSDIKHTEKIDAANLHGADHEQRAAVDAYYLPFGNATTPQAFEAITREVDPSQIVAAESAAADADAGDDPILAALSAAAANASLDTTMTKSGRRAMNASTHAGESPRTPNVNEDIKEESANALGSPKQAQATSDALAALSDAERDALLKRVLKDKYEAENNERPKWSASHYFMRMSEKGLINEWKEFLRILKAQSANSNTVKRIDLSNLAIGEVGCWAIARALEERPQLEQLTLNACLHTHSWTSTLSNDFGLQSLTTALCNSTLQYLRLDDCSIGRRGAKLLASFVSQSRTLRLLSLANNRLGANVYKAVPLSALPADADVDPTAPPPRVVIQAAPALAELLAAVLQCSSLMSVRLSGNGIDSHGAALVAAALINPKCALRSLAIGDNPLDALALHHLSQAVMSNRMLQMLEIRGGANGRCNAASLVPLLKNIAKYNDTISWLDVSGHLLQQQSAETDVKSASGAAPPSAAATVSDDSAGAAIASLLRRDPRLYPTVGSRIVHLVVANAGLNGKAFTSIADALASNSSLTHLDLSGNSRVDDASLGRVLASLSKHTSLRSCNLSGAGSSAGAVSSGLGPLSAAALGKVLQENITMRMLYVGPKSTVHLSLTELAAINAVDAAYPAPALTATGKKDASAAGGDAAYVAIGRALMSRTVSKLALQRLVLRGACEGTVSGGSAAAAAMSGSSVGSSALASGLASAAAAAVLPALESLDVGGHEWTSDGWNTLCSAISGFKALKELIVSQSRVPVASRKDNSSVSFSLADSSSIMAAVSGTGANGSVETPDHKRVTAALHAAANASANAGAGSGNKHNLDGRGNAVFALVTAARSVACRAIDLSGSALGDDGAAGLAIALRDNNCVMSLLLSACMLEASDPKHSPSPSMAGGSIDLKSSPALPSAGVSGSTAAGGGAASRKGILAFVDCLASDKVLRNLSLRSNHLSVGVVGRLSLSLRRNRSLTMLDLTHNSFPTYTEDVGRVIYDLVSASQALQWLSLPSILPFHSGGHHRTLNGVCVQCGRNAAAVAAAAAAASALAAAKKAKPASAARKKQTAKAADARQRRLLRQQAAAAAKHKANGDEEPNAAGDDDDAVSDDAGGDSAASGDNSDDSAHGAGSGDESGDATSADDEDEDEEDDATVTAAGGDATPPSATADGDAIVDSAPPSTGVSPNLPNRALATNTAGATTGAKGDSKSGARPSAAAAAAALAAAAPPLTLTQQRQLLLCPNTGAAHRYLEGLCLLCGQAPLPPPAGTAAAAVLSSDACVLSDEKVSVLRGKQKDHLVRLLATGLQKNSGSHLRSLFIGPLASSLSTAQKKVLLSSLTRTSRLSLIGTHPTQTTPSAITLIGGPVEPAFVHHTTSASASAASGGSHAHPHTHPHGVHTHTESEDGESVSRGWVEADPDTQLAAVSHNALIARLASNRQVYG